LGGRWEGGGAGDPPFGLGAVAIVAEGFVGAPPFGRVGATPFPSAGGASVVGFGMVYIVFARCALHFPGFGVQWAVGTVRW
jgi:hypothetical protein